MEVGVFWREGRRAVLRSGVHRGGNRVHIRESIGDIVALLLMTDL